MEDNQIEEYIKNSILVLDDNGKLKCRERVDLEYKETFNIGSASKYAKVMASFANNVGGYIIFGVKDKPREVIGVNSAFYELNQDKLTEILNSYFSPEIIWEYGVADCGDKAVGYIYVFESLDKPIMAIKGDGNINNGDVYYRYKARTEKIKYPEMMKIISDREKRIQDNILKVIETIRNDKTPNIGILNYDNGKVSTPYGIDVAIDKKLIIQVLKKAKFIKSGTFEEGGEPVLKVTGDIRLAEEIPVPDVEPDIQYPYIQKDLQEQLGIKKQELYALVWKFGLKEQKKFHAEITTSRHGKIHKFSQYALDYLAEIIREHKDDEGWLDSITNQFNKRHKEQDV